MWSADDCDGNDVYVVCVQDFPPRHGIVRGISYLTGYHMISTAGDVNENGCEVTYLTQSDPKGTLLTVNCGIIVQFLANVNMSSRSLYAVARLSSVCNVRAPYSGGSNFRQYCYGIRYLGHPLTSTENFTEIVPGEPLRRGS